MKRVKKYSEKAILRARMQIRNEQRMRIVQVLNHTLPGKQVLAMANAHGGIYLKKNVDLRANFEEKVLDSHKGSRWTAFLNKKCTLVHIVPASKSFSVRLPIHESLRNMTDSQIKQLMLDQFWAHL